MEKRTDKVVKKMMPRSRRGREPHGHIDAGPSAMNSIAAVPPSSAPNPCSTTSPSPRPHQAVSPSSIHNAVDSAVEPSCLAQRRCLVQSSLSALRRREKYKKERARQKLTQREDQKKEKAKKKEEESGEERRNRRKEGGKEIERERKEAD